MQHVCCDCYEDCIKKLEVRGDLRFNLVQNWLNLLPMRNVISVFGVYLMNIKMRV